MTRRKPLTRFTVLANGVERQLFKVRDRGSELVVMMVGGQVFRGGFHHGAEVLERRFSVHSSPNSLRNSNVIKQTLRLSGGHLVESILHAGGPKSNLPNTICLKLCTSMEDSRYDVGASSKDTVIKMGSFDARSQTFVYGILVSSIGGPNSLELEPEFQQTNCDFGNFRVMVVWSFIPIPSSTEGDFISLSSSHPRFDGEDVSALQLPIDVEAVLPIELTKAVLTGSFENLRYKAISRIPRHVPFEVVQAIRDVGFGVWTVDEQRKKIRSKIR